MATKRLNEQVRRNRRRFPEDFMFRLTKTEAEGLRSQFATSKPARLGLTSQSAISKKGLGKAFSTLKALRDRRSDYLFLALRAASAAARYSGVQRNTW